MFQIVQPPQIIFGKNSSHDFQYPDGSLLITSKGAKSRGNIDHINLNDAIIFDEVESNPSFNTVNKIIEKFENENFSSIIGLGGGSVLDVAKFSAFKMKKIKILIPTTFGSGSEMTKISVLKINGKKQSFHDNQLIANTAIVDSYFLKNINEKVMKYAIIDACAQCTEAFDSKNGNTFTKYLCARAFDFLEEGILKNDKEKIVLGSMLTGLGFGNSSTTLGHALSYVFSNEGISHGHALAFTTIESHKFNKSKFLIRFKNIVEKLIFEKISLKQPLEEAAELILGDKKHLDNNPKNITKEQIISILNHINSGNSID